MCISIQYTVYGIQYRSEARYYVRISNAVNARSARVYLLTTRGVNEAKTRQKRGRYAVKMSEKRVCSAFHVRAETRARTRLELCILERGVSCGDPVRKREALASALF